ncbi:MAG: hypothetical protein LBQ47_03720, partial [Endomicrobium sp.]|nr:hypothetical protein [Endomicrobium sp.]
MKLIAKKLGLLLFCMSVFLNASAFAATSEDKSYVLRQIWDGKTLKRIHILHFNEDDKVKRIFSLDPENGDAMCREFDVKAYYNPNFKNVLYTTVNVNIKDPESDIVLFSGEAPIVLDKSETDRRIEAIELSTEASRCKYGGLARLKKLQKQKSDVVKKVADLANNANVENIEIIFHGEAFSVPQTPELKNLAKNAKSIFAEIEVSSFEEGVPAPPTPDLEQCILQFPVQCSY